MAITDQLTAGTLLISPILAGAWSASLGGLVTFAALGGDTQVAVIWGALVGSIGVSGLGILWKVWRRFTVIIEATIDLGFDKIEHKLGIDHKDFDKTEITTALDDLLKDPEDQ